MVSAMSITLESLKAEVDILHYTVGMADLDAVETKQLLRAQTSVLNALRKDQRGLWAAMDSQNQALSDQATAIGELVLHQNNLQGDIRKLSRHMLATHERLGTRIGAVEQGLGSLGTRIDGVEQGLGTRIDGVEQRLGGRMDKMDLRMDKMDKNIEAIMDHMGIGRDDKEGK